MTDSIPHDVKSPEAPDTAASPEPPAPEAPLSWDQKLTARKKKRSLPLRSLMFLTGISTHERIASWAFKRPVSVDLKKKQVDLYQAAEIVVEKWGRPWMKVRLFSFRFWRFSFKGVQVGTLGLFGIGLGIPCLLIAFAISRLVINVHHRIGSRPSLSVPLGSNRPHPRPPQPPPSPAPSEPAR